MISLILPYWDRQEAADRAILQLAKVYKDFDLEVIVVDDGNFIPFRSPECDLNIKIVRLPRKSGPTPQSKAWNAGVKAASSEVIVLSCVEIIHETPVLKQMVDQLGFVGAKKYILAATWAKEAQEWQCHSTHRFALCPKGTGPSFLGMTYKSLFYAAGGFDESYQYGCGYEDKDFVWRMKRAGANFIIRDDLKVVHPKEGALIKWSPEGFQRNRELFFEKWPEARNEMITFVCLKWGTEFSADYVNILYDSVTRNTSPDIIDKFVCFTDDPTGIDEGIDIRQLPEALTEWWGKLYLFKKGVFQLGSRVCFMDLDTVITGSLDEMLTYDGEFAAIRDPIVENRVGLGVFLWKVSDVTHSIWDEWLACGMPKTDLGDMGWVMSLDQGRFAKRVEILQDLYPGQLVSYKADCQVSPPPSARIVYFHGIPRPHQVKDGWVKLFWCKDGYSNADFRVICNTNIERVIGNIRYSSGLDLDWLEMKPEHQKRAILCGGGPSIANSIEEIRFQKDSGAVIFTMNGSDKYLHDHGIKSDIYTMIDSRPENIRFLAGTASSQFFIASQCDPSIFDALQHKKVILFHIDIPKIGEYVPGDKPIQAIGGGSTVGLMAMCIAYTQGFRDIHLYGYDSSYKDGAGHAYNQVQTEDAVEAFVNGRTFQSTPWMVTQTTQWQTLANSLRSLGCGITVHGEGLLPYLAWCMSLGKT